MKTSLNKLYVIAALSISLYSSAPVYSSDLTVSSMTGIGKLQLRAQALAMKTELEALRAMTRWNHAKELLGKSYAKSAAINGESVAELDPILVEWIRSNLSNRWKKSALQIAQAVIRESNNYHFDPVLLLAIIKSESNFNPEIIGAAGEIGLMQVMPQTAAWIAKKSGFAWNKKSRLQDPVTNIKIGAAYVAYLRERFESEGQLYLAAYNMGVSNVQRALANQVRPSQYASRVMSQYIKFYAELKLSTDKKYN